MRNIPTTIALVLVFLLGCALASAGVPTVTVNSPLNNTIKTNPVKFNITAYANYSFYSCTLYTNTSGTWTAVETNSGVANNTPTAFNTVTASETVGKQYRWNVNCSGVGSTEWYWISGTYANSSITNTSYWFGVDDTVPSITVDTPADEFWDTNGYINISLTVIDKNAQSCYITSTMNTSSNSTQVMTSLTPVSYTNGTQFQFTGFDGSTIYLADNNTGAYTWNATCVDNASNVATVSTRTIYVDTTTPVAFDFNSTLFRTTNSVVFFNNSLCSDYTPEFGWNATVEINFNRYVLSLWNDSSCADTAISVNITTRTQKNYSSSTLTQNKTYYATLIAYDDAGNYKNASSNCGILYKTTPTNLGHNLNSGWNIVPNLGNERNASYILTDTGATTIAYLNTSGEFETYTSGGTDFRIKSGKAFFAYFSSTGSAWNDLVVNATAHGTLFNVTSTANTNWSIGINLNSSTTFVFADLDYYINGGNSTFGSRTYNVTYMVLYNNSADVNHKYIDYKSNWTFNYNKPIAYGDPVWFLNQAAANTSDPLLIDFASVYDRD